MTPAFLSPCFRFFKPGKEVLKMGRRIFLLWLAVILTLSPLNSRAAEENWAVVYGRACVPYQSPESRLEAREIAVRNAKRNALTDFMSYVESETKVINFTVDKDEVGVLTEGYLRQVETTAVQDDGSAICVDIKALVDGREMENLLKERVEKARQAQIRLKNLSRPCRGVSLGFPKPAMIGR
jgi:heme exporter protein D